VEERTATARDNVMPCRFTAGFARNNVMCEVMQVSSQMQAHYTPILQSRQQSVKVRLSNHAHVCVIQQPKRTMANQHVIKTIPAGCFVQLNDVLLDGCHLCLL
jgi:hypothetical protein